MTKSFDDPSLITGIGGIPGIESLTIERCPKCRGTIFDQKVQLRILPSVHPMNQSGQTAHIPVPVVVCCKCLWNLADDYDPSEELEKMGLNAQELMAEMFGEHAAEMFGEHSNSEEISEDVSKSDPVSPNPDENIIPFNRIIIPD